MGPIQVKDGVRSNSECVEHGKFGVVTKVKITKEKYKPKELTFYVLWDKYKHSVPHSRKSLSRDHTLRDIAKGEIYKMVEAKVKAQMESSEEIPSIVDVVDVSSRVYKPTTRDYYREKKEETRLAEIAEIEKAAAEESELEKRLNENLKVNATEYKSPELSNVIFANYLQHKHKIASDYSKGPCYVFLPYKIVV
jgi:hypothetical protein